MNDNTVISTGRRARRIITASLSATAALALLAGCAGATDGSGDSGKTEATFQLGWIANVENMGPYVADNSGFYTEEGLDMKLTPGGPSVSIPPLVASGKTLIGLDSVDTIAKARLAGADLKIVGATLQVNPTSIMSLESAPVNSLKDLVGKRLCIQTSGIELFKTVLTSNSIDPDSITYVTADFDPAPLVTGDCDAFLSFLNNQPVALAQQGIKTKVFSLSDYGYHVWADVYVVSGETLADPAKRTAVVKALRASVRGWEKALADPKAASKLIVDKYGKNLKLDLANQELAADSYKGLIVTADTEKNGLLTMSADGIAKNIATLKLLGIDITAKDLFDTSLLKEAFNGKTTL